MAPIRGRMKPWNSFLKGKFFIASLKRADDDIRGEIIYEFKIFNGYDEKNFKAGPLITTLSVDYHSDIDGGTFFFEEDNGEKHVTIDQFKSQPEYDEIESRVIEYINKVYAEKE